MVSDLDSSDGSISEVESEDFEHKISVSALVTSLQELKPKRKLPKKNKDIFAEWGAPEVSVSKTKKKPVIKKSLEPAKKSEETKPKQAKSKQAKSKQTKLAETKSEPETPKSKGPKPTKPVIESTIIDLTSETEMDTTEQPTTISEPDIPKVPTTTPVKPKKSRAKVAPKPVATPTRRSSRLRK